MGRIQRRVNIAQSFHRGMVLPSQKRRNVWLDKGFPKRRFLLWTSQDSSGLMHTRDNKATNHHTEQSHSIWLCLYIAPFCRLWKSPQPIPSDMNGKDLQNEKNLRRLLFWISSGYGLGMPWICRSSRRYGIHLLLQRRSLHRRRLFLQHLRKALGKRIVSRQNIRMKINGATPKQNCQKIFLMNGLKMLETNNKGT